MATTKRIALSGAAVAALLVAGGAAWASSHREAPGITEQPKIDGTDLYMFRSYEPGREEYVTLIANYQPLQEPYGGPNYFTMDPDAIYEIHVDNNGDAIEDITFQFNFDNDLVNRGRGIRLPVGDRSVPIPLRQAGQITAESPTAALNERETYTVRMIRGDRRSGRGAFLTADGSQRRVFTKPVDNIGEKTIPDYETYANSHIFNVAIPNCDRPGRVFVGQREEAFAVSLGEIFDLVNLVPVQGESNPEYPQYDVASPFPGGAVQNRGDDDLIGQHNITSLALEIPISCLTTSKDPVIGAWTTASLPRVQVRNPSPTYETSSTFSGPLVQQSRLGNPLVNEVVIGLPDKDRFNASEPMNDGRFATYVTHPTLPELIEILFPIAPAPNNIPRTDLVATFLTGFPGLNAPSGRNTRASEMLRLNTAVPPTPREEQHTFGVVAEDLAGFPNGRRPGDDVVDIALRVVMGALCHPVPLGAELAGDTSLEDTEADLVNLGFCEPEDAPAGNVPFTDAAPLSATELRNEFPYLNTPLPGSPRDY